MKYMTSEEFYSALESNEYGRQYLELIEKVQSEHRGPKKRGDGYEKHHIQPRALSGDLKAKKNLVKLTIFEHILSHYWLAIIFEGEMLYAFNMLTNRAFSSCSELEQISLEELKLWSEIRSKAAHRPHTEEEIQKMKASQAKTVRRKHIWTEEERQRFSEAHRGRAAWNKGIKFAEAGIVRHISEQGHLHMVEAGRKHTGYVRVNNGTVQKSVKPEELQLYLDQGYVKGSLGTSQKGSIHIHKGDERKMISPEELDKYLAEGWERGRGNPTWNYGRVLSEETRRKMSEKRKGRKASDELRKRQSEAKKGRIHIYKNTERKMIKPEELEHYLAEGWTQGRLFNKHIQESLKNER